MARVLGEKSKNHHQEIKRSSFLPVENHTYFITTYADNSTAARAAAAPRKRSTLSKLRDSLRVFGRSKSSSPDKKQDNNTDAVKNKTNNNTAVLDPPRYSCDGIGDQFKVKEPPRRSLDSRIFLGTRNSFDDHPLSFEPPRRSFDVSMLSSRAYHGRDQNSSTFRPGSNVVARLMGLSDMIHPWPDDDGQAEAGHGQLQDLFKEEIACSKEEKSNESNISARIVSSPERNQQQQQRKSPIFSAKTKQDMTVISATLQEQACSLQKVVERLERLRQSESLRLEAAARARASDGDGDGDGSNAGRATPGDSSVDGQSSLSQELLELKEIREVVAGATQLSEKSKRGEQRHQEISPGTNSQARKSTLVVKTRQAPRQHSSGTGSGSSNRDKRTKQAFVPKDEKAFSGSSSSSRRNITQTRKAPPLARSSTSSPKKGFVPAVESSSKGHGSRLMRPTIASSARQQRTPSKRLERRLKEWSRVRDQSESRAALLTLRDANKKKVVARSGLDSDGGDLEREQCCQKGFRQYNSGETVTEKRTTTVLSASSHHCEFPSTKPSVDVFENWSSPVSVLEAAPSQEDVDEDAAELFKSSPGPDRQVRNVEPDKSLETSKVLKPEQQRTTAPVSSSSSSPRRKDGELLLGLKLFNAAFSIVFDEQECWPMHVCSDHWSRHRRCARCMAQLCVQVDAAIFDDLVYDSIIQLNAQHIQKRMRMT